MVRGAITRMAKSGCKILPRAVPETGSPVAAQRTGEAGMSRSKKTKPKQPPAKQYTPTKKEELAVDTIVERRKARTCGADMRLTPDGDATVLDFDHEDQDTAHALAMYEIGTADIRFFRGLLEQIASLGAPGSRRSERTSNFALGVIASIEPRDEVEAMLALQMATVHQATMVMARRLTHCETIPQQDSAERALNKLARTYTNQAETLKRYRSNGKQVVRVERVEVNEGGQAVVGDVSYRRGEDDEK